MKQTNNAIKFLMAQYRAIFKNAYFKGMATALVLTAGLAAGAAQAADNFYYVQSGNDWKNLPDGAGLSTTTIAAGAYEDDRSNPPSSDGDVLDGVASGGSLTIGTASGSDVNKTTAGAYGGYAHISTGSMSAIATDNKVYLYSGGSVGQHLVGGWAKQAGDGTAQAYLNSVTVSGNATTSSLSVGNQVIGAWASSKHGATASQNTVTISGGMENRGFSFQASGGGIYGTQVWADTGAVEGNYTTDTNKVSITNVTLTADKVGNIVGGHVYANDTTTAGE